MSRVAWVVTVAALLAPSVALADPPFSMRMRPDPALMDPRVTDFGSPAVREPVPEGVAHAAVSNIIYLNRCTGGCRITKSGFPSNSVNNNTYIGGDIPIGSQFMISEFAFPQAVWDEFVQCMREVYAPYNVVITTDDPSPTPHHEAVVAGNTQEWGLPDGVLGQGEGGGNQCTPRDNAISINIANDHTGFAGLTVADNLCWTVAQETAHTWGLDHAFDCTDSMTYIPTCGRKYFRNLDLPCGENVERPCNCGGNTQNSHAKILGVFGAGTGPQLVPTLTIDAPQDGAAFPAGASIFATANSKRGLNHIEVLVNGWKWVDRPATTNSTYQIALPAEVPDGVMDLMVRACDDIGVCAEDMITVTRGAACTTADTCALGQRCDGGRCLWDAPTLEVGATCEFPQACLSLTCEDVNGGLICTEECQGGPNDRCPTGFECGAAVGEPGLCVPEGGSEETGCCSVNGGGGRAVAFQLGLGAVVGLIAVRRRRRKKA